MTGRGDVLLRRTLTQRLMEIFEIYDGCDRDPRRDSEKVREIVGIMYKFLVRKLEREIVKVRPTKRGLNLLSRSCWKGRHS